MDQPTVEKPLCVTYEGHHPGDTTCSRCGDYWHAQAELHAPHVQCGDVHAHEGHAWWWAGDPSFKWCTGVERCPEVARLTAELERYREHSTTLNTVAYKLAEALGDIPQGQHWSEGNPVELAERLIAKCDKLWNDCALAESERDEARAEVATLTGERDDALLTIQSMTHGDPR